VLSTDYILIRIFLEERNLIAQFGDQYRRYREEVSMLIPLPRGSMQICGVHYAADEIGSLAFAGRKPG
jgi:hypothetical protein